MAITPLRSRWLSSGAVALALACSAATVLHAEDDDPDAPLLPIPDLLTPRVRAGPASEPKGCGDIPDAAALPRAPFGPGETLSYDVKVVGIRTGQLHLQVKKPTRVDGVDVVPVQASARTDSMFSVLGGVDGRMISYLHAHHLKPVRMVNRFSVDQPLGDDYVLRDDAAFSVDDQVAARLSYTQDGREKVWPGTAAATADLVDVLSVVYYARSRDLAPSSTFCIEVYHQRRLYRVRGQVRGLENVATPMGTRRAHKVEASFQRTTKKHGTTGPVRHVDIWVSDDELRLPLRVSSKDSWGELSVVLSTFLRGASG